MDVVTKAITLLTECYGQLGGEPDMERDLEGELLNPASVELFKALEDFFESVTGLQDEQLREWIMTPTDSNQISDYLFHWGILKKNSPKLKICPECHNTFVPKRANQVYCPPPSYSQGTESLCAAKKRMKSYRDKKLGLKNSINSIEEN